MTAKKPKPIDQACLDLAESFMSDVKGHTPQHIQELAEAIQTACEDHCSTAEADCLPELPTTKSDVAREMEKAMGPRENPAHPMFRDHNCAYCGSGEKPCRQGNPGRCEYPHARND